MTSFSYANPKTEAELLSLLGDSKPSTALLAGGTDLVPLLQARLVTPERVVDLRQVDSMQGITEEADGLWIGALTTLDELNRSELLESYASLKQVVDGIRSLQVQSSGTLGGDLCLLPNCWYFRNGYGLLGIDKGESLPATGDNRYHAIFGNQGPAKFVSASRLAPALIAWGAKARIIGPQSEKPDLIPLELLFQTPKTNSQGVTTLKPGQLVSHVWLPKAGSEQISGSYEALQLQGLDWPLAACSATLEMAGNVVRQARIVLGHVAPTPWEAPHAASSLIGQPVNESTASRAADIAVENAVPLSHNEYKVQIARASVKRSILRAAGLLEGGL